MRFECLDCHCQTFTVHVPTKGKRKDEEVEIVPKGQRYLFIICKQCGKPYRLENPQINEGFLERANICPCLTKEVKI